MAITKQQKEKAIEVGKKELADSSVVLFADYKGTSVSDIGTLRRSLKDVSASMKVLKKRLLRIVLKDAGFDLDPTKFDGQVAAIFGRGTVSDVAGPLYRFSKEHEGFEVLGGLDVKEKTELSREMVIKIGSLPSREVLLGQVVGVISAPIRAFIYVLSQKAQK